VKLELHPNAAARFNEQANELLLELSPEPPDETASQGGSFVPDVPVRAEFTSEEVTQRQLWTGDPAGNVLSRYFEHSGKNIGLFGDGYKKLVHAGGKGPTVIRRAPFRYKSTGRASPSSGCNTR
jgi:hypothetical protein